MLHREQYNRATSEITPCSLHTILGFFQQQYDGLVVGLSSRGFGSRIGREQERGTEHETKRRLQQRRSGQDLRVVAALSGDDEDD